MADGVIMNKVHNKSSKPCYIRLSNLDDSILNSHDTLKCVGYGPEYLFTEAQLMDMIITEVSTKEKRKQILTYMKRKFTQEYVLEVAKHILENQEHGLSMQVGLKNSTTHYFIPIVFSFLGDSA